ncbi:hypothetical protein C0J52_08294 [Blattella germanica]|nr:hypothetical protein C0J52_08294 [Blattella germanica]
MWDATVSASYLPITSQSSGSAAELAVMHEKNKYRALVDNFIFIAFAVQTYRPWCREALDLVSEIGKQLRVLTCDPRATEFLRQRISIAIQMGNATNSTGFLHGSGGKDLEKEQRTMYKTRLCKDINKISGAHKLHDTHPAVPMTIRDVQLIFNPFTVMDGVSPSWRKCAQHVMDGQHVVLRCHFACDRKGSPNN